MSKELEEIKSLVFIHFGALGFYNPSMNNEIIRDRDKVLKYLDSLEAIDNSKPSEALKCLDRLDIAVRYSTIDDEGYSLKEPRKMTNICDEEFNTIKQALIKSQEQEKVLEIIKEYQVDIWLLKQCDYENYIRIRNEAMVSVGQIVNENGIILENEITQEEFDLLKRYFK